MLGAIMVLFYFPGPGAGWCHGVDGNNVKPITAQSITAMYDDGEPMSYAAVKITAPDSDVEFQNGRTDRNGYFVINPDMPGNWKAVITDGMGHRLVLDFTVDADGGSALEKTAGKATVHNGVERPVSRPAGIAVGLSVIFGISGLTYGWSARRKKSAEL